MKLISLKLIVFSIFFLSLVTITDTSAQQSLPQHVLRVSSSPNILYISGSGIYDEGTVVNIDEVPETWQEYEFAGWKIDGQWTNENPLSLTMDKSHTVEAIYTKSLGTGSILIDAIPRVTEITVDGTIYLPDELPLSFDWPSGSEHTLIISDVVKQTANTRHKFDSWKDVNHETTRAITVDEKSHNFIAIYKTQHFLKPISQYGSVIGGGWQDEGSSVSFELESDVVTNKKNDNIRYVFNSWDLGDYLNSPTNIIDVSEPIAVKANWDEQYNLELVTNISDYKPFGSGWYDNGRQVALIAEPSLTSPNSDEEYAFEKWVSKGPNPVIIPNALEPSTTIIMDEPYVIEAKYKKAFRVNVWTPFGSAIGSGFYPEGSTAEITMSQSEVIVDYNKIKKVFSGWDTHGAKTMNFGSDYPNEGEDMAAGFQNLVVIVDRPLNITANWKTQYYLDVQSTDGKVEGSGWYDLGRLVPVSAKLPTTPPGMWSKTVFDKWEGDYNEVTPNGRVMMNEPKTIIAEWKEDSTPAIINSIILGSVGGTALIIYSKTRNGKLSFRKSKKPLTVNEQEDGFDKFFNTRTRSFDTSNQPSFISSKPKIINKIIGWLLDK